MPDYYPDGDCPDCGEPIDPKTEEGQSCENCGHVLWSEAEYDE